MADAYGLAEPGHNLQDVGVSDQPEPAVDRIITRLDNGWRVSQVEPPPWCGAYVLASKAVCSGELPGTVGFGWLSDNR